MPKKQKGVVVSNPVNIKEYSYQLDGITLNFSLRQDNSKGMLAFKEMCKLAIEDIEKDILAIRKK